MCKMHSTKLKQQAWKIKRFNEALKTNKRSHTKKQKHSLTCCLIKFI